MAARFLIIDGYNLLHAAGMARHDYGPGELQRCRNRLLKFLLDRLTSAEIARASVVFDARDPPPGFPSQFTIAGLRVIFANPGGDADVMIEQLIADHSAPRQLRLISTDRRLQAAARKRRAAFSDSEAFFDELDQRPASPRHAKGGAAPADAKLTGRVSEAETAHWLKIFGDVAGVDELNQRSQAPRPEPVSPPKPHLPPASVPPTAKDEIAEWIELFGEIPEVRELNSKSGISQLDVDQWIAEFEEEDGKR